VDVSIVSIQRNLSEKLWNNTIYPRYLSTIIYLVMVVQMLALKF